MAARVPALRKVKDVMKVDEQRMTLPSSIKGHEAADGPAPFPAHIEQPPHRLRETGRKGSLLAELSKNKLMFMMIIPALVFFIIFSYLPMAGLVLAFKDYNFRDGIFGSPWVWFKNFKFLFIAGSFGGVLRNTVLYNLAFMITCNIAQVLFAIFISEIAFRAFKRVCQTLSFLPFFVSFVLVGVFAYNFFNYEYGSINLLLRSMNVEPVNFYAEPAIWPFILTFFNGWRWLGYGSVIYLAAILSINQELYESAFMDGSSLFQSTWYITLPSLKPTFAILFLMNIGQIFRGQFELFYQLVGNNPRLLGSTDVIDTYVFRALVGSHSFNIGMGAAAGLLQSVLGFAALAFANYILKRIQDDYAIF